MADYALVLNAGSSSLKFCVLQRSKGRSWRLEARGQIEGIATAPRLSVKDEQGAKLADEKLSQSVRDGSAAIDVLASVTRCSMRWITRRSIQI
jgi:acetate kinase